MSCLQWSHAGRYGDFLKRAAGRRLALLELGVGFNTPAIIRFPFEKMLCENSGWSLIRLNLDDAAVPESLGSRAVGINMDLAVCLEDISAALGDRAGEGSGPGK